MKRVSLNVDLAAKVTGFDSARQSTTAHHRIVENYASPLLLGPPPSEVLLEWVMHMYTEDEADLVQHLPPLRPRTVKRVARRAGRSEADVRQVLEHLANVKKVILSTGEPKKYTILPVVPGTFEWSLMTPDLSTRNSWHKTFAEIFERLWDTGFLVDYPGRAIWRAPVRYLPASSLSETLYMAWPSEKLEELLEPHDLFAVGHCQCRTAMNLVDRGCGRETENCLGIGQLAQPFIDRGMMRRIDRAEALAIKKAAEAEGSITWMVNAAGAKYGNVSCSCCGCCCHALRGIKELKAPWLVSRPHYVPARDVEACTDCEDCIAACPMDAWTLADDGMTFDRMRCVGCGLCVGACSFDALSLEPVKEAVPVDQSWRQLVLGSTPTYLSNSLRIWAKRLFSSTSQRD